MNNIFLKKLLFLLFYSVSNAVIANPLILIVYYSKTGHTMTLAEAIYRGAKSVENAGIARRWDKIKYKNAFSRMKTC